MGWVTTYTPTATGGLSSRDESKFGNLTGNYHAVLVAFYQARDFEIPESRFLGSPDQ